MSKPITKQKPPPYPRPVEYVCGDEVSLSLEELRYQDKLDKRNGLLQLNKHDAELEAKRRAAKRRRIEGHAAAYLRGESLYIMSAQLKGPFGKPWTNPWAKKKSDHLAVVKQSRTAEVPETAKTSHATVEDVREERGVLLGVKKQNNVLESAGQVDVPDQWSSNGVVPPTSPIMTSPCRSPDKTTTLKPGEVKSTRIRDWLKTNEKYLNRSEALPTASPTPTTTSRFIDPVSVRSPYFALQHSTSDRAAENNTAAVPINQTISENGLRLNQVERGGPAVRPETRTQNGHYPTPSEISHDLRPDQAQGERTADRITGASRTVNDNRISLHVAPPNANFSPFEYKRTNSRKATDLKQGLVKQRNASDAPKSHSEDLKMTSGQSPDKFSQEDVSVFKEPQGGITIAEASEIYIQSNGSFGNKADHGEGDDSKRDQEVERAEQKAIKLAPVEQDSAQFTTHQQSRPLLSMSTSDINTADLLPSAQKAPELVPTLSSGFHAHDLLKVRKRDEPDLADDQTSDFTPIELVSDNDVTPNKNVTEEHTRKSGVNSSPYGSIVQKDIPLVLSSPIVPRSTQEMLAGISPFTLSTIKKRTRDSLQDSPVTATKKKRKTASFAPDLHSSTSSHGSIQSTMRGKIGKKLSSPPPLIIKDSMCIDMDMDVPENNHPSNPSSMPIQPMKKTISKLTNSSPSFLRQSRISPFSECEQDRRQQVTTTAATSESIIPVGSGQNKKDKTMNEDSYDLDAEISEIGSFLDPWQIDKEIEEMAA